MTYRNSAGEEIPEARGVATLAVKVLRGYQRYLSPLKMVSTCRFEPTCSAYALEAYSRHGVLRGTALSVARLAKCGPWHPGGFDPVAEVIKTEE